ncbi:cytochrome c oxidase copper chaperone [Rhopalosiphum maidis]|uniref:cytochrome c oxidase copper chaperone n=1 Tax=Rhopalosiphum maidis TaxID=43146 RepID=UPI000EFEEF88|nr:cytochrome c oxidase copper chaperone [Rhopalosiphum maidis]
MMPLVSDKSIAPSSENKPAEEPKKLKACCACPETKRTRDACIMENGEENCRHLIEAHKECMRKMGFNI